MKRDILLMLLLISVVSVGVLGEQFTEEEAYTRMLYGIGYDYDFHTLDPYIRIARGIVNDNQVVARAFPTLQGDMIMGALLRGDEVAVYGKSTFTERIGDHEARWVQIVWDKRRAWVFGYYVDIDERAYKQLPIIAISQVEITETAYHGHGLDSDDLDYSVFPRAVLTEEDIEKILQRHQAGLGKDFSILGKIRPTNDDLSAMGMKWHGGTLLTLFGYAKYYGTTQLFAEGHSHPRYEDTIIILLTEEHEYDDNIDISYILDYVIVEYETDDENPYVLYTSYGVINSNAVIRINGIRVTKTACIVWVFKDNDTQYDAYEVRNDVLFAYFVDFRSKTWWQMSEQDVRAMEYYIVPAH